MKTEYKMIPIPLDRKPIVGDIGKHKNGLVAYLTQELYDKAVRFNDIENIIPQQVILTSNETYNFGELVHDDDKVIASNILIEGIPQFRQQDLERWVELGCPEEVDVRTKEVFIEDVGITYNIPSKTENQIQLTEQNEVILILPEKIIPTVQEVKNQMQNDYLKPQEEKRCKACFYYDKPVKVYKFNPCEHMGTIEDNPNNCENFVKQQPQEAKIAENYPKQIRNMAGVILQTIYNNGKYDIGTPSKGQIIDGMVDLAVSPLVKEYWANQPVGSDDLFQQIKTKENNPNKNGWYNTDKGLLYYFTDEKEWSCRDERISEEYPTFWYKQLKNK
jgi:hypothetical protein